jgi:23S rRNA (uracil1939-C5)-methyltransferase
LARSFTQEVEITRLGGHGDGVAETPKGLVFVPYTAPGDRVGVRLTKAVEHGMAGELLELRAAGPDRVEPPCAHFHDCGGCAFQHLSAGFQSAWKRDQVREALRRRGLDPEVVQPTATVAPGDRRRAEFVLRKVGARVLAGFNRRLSPKIVDLEMCLVLDPALVALLPALRDTFAALLKPGAGLDVQATLTETGIDMVLRGFEPDLAARERLARFAETAGLARLSLRRRDGEVEAIVVRGTPQVSFGGVPVALPPGAFLQASAAAERLLCDAVLAAVADAARVADLYAGCGTFALPLSAAAQVTAVEADAGQAEGLRKAAQLAGRRVTVESRDLVRRPLQGAELDRFDAVVLDPPRAGAREQAVALAASNVPRIVMVSCMPGTFARDARILADGGYHLVEVQPVDQFVFTPHIELVGVFSR